MALDRQSTSQRIVLTIVRQVLAMLLRLGFIVVSARALGPQGNGQYALAMLVPTLLTATLHLGIPTANVYFVASGALDLRRALRLNARLGSALAAAGMALIGLAFVLRARVLPGLTAESIALAGLLFPVTLAGSFLSGLVQAHKDFTGFNRALSVAPVLSLALLGAIWLRQIPVAVEHVLLIQLVAELAATLYFWQVLHRHLRAAASSAPPDSIGIRTLLKFAGSLQVGSVLMQLSYRLDLFLVNLYLGTAAAGIYYIGVRITEQVWHASQSVGSVLMPELSGRETNERNAAPALAGTAVRLLLYPGLALGLLLAVIAPLLVQWLFGRAYERSTEVVLLMLPGALVLNAARVACVAMAARGKPGLTLIVNVGVFAINLGANLWLIPRLQLIGAAVATSVSYAAGTIIALVLLARVQGESVWRLLTPTSHDLAAIRNFARRRPRAPESA